MLVRLQVESFRNLASLTWLPGPGRHLLLGANGAGKTSLLEAIYVLATTRSFRTAQLRDCCRGGGSEFTLAGEAARDGARVSLAVHWSAAGRARTVNGRGSSLAEHVAALPVLAWSEAEAEVLAGPPAHRRRFLDRGMVVERPALLAVLARYQRALQAKREVLQRGGRDLEAWNDLLAELGAELAAARAEYVARVTARLAALLAAHEPRFAGLELAYEPHPAEALAGAAALRARLERATASERERRMPLVGPHRDDVAVRWRGADLRRVASAGERKSLGMFLLAAQALVLETAGEIPLLLLDDADAELDRGALERVWRAVSVAPQVIATSSRPEVWEGLADLARVAVENGRLAGA